MSQPAGDDKIGPLQEKLKTLQADNAKLTEKVQQQADLEKAARQKLEALREKLRIREEEIKILRQTFDYHLEELNSKTTDLERIATIDSAELHKEHQELLHKLKDLEEKNSKLKHSICHPEEIIEESKDGASLAKLKRKEVKPITLDEVSKKIKIEKEAFGHLSTNTISQIFDALCEYGYPKYHELVVKMRQERREQVENFEKRIEISNAYATQFNTLFEDLQKELLAHLGITQENLFLSIESHAAKGDTQVLYLFQMLTEKMRMMKKGDRYLSKDTLKGILTFKKDFVLKSIDRVRKVAENNKTNRKFLDGLLMDYTSLIYDEIYKYFGYEEEDLVSALASPDVQFDMELNSLLVENDNIMKGVLPNLIPPPPKEEVVAEVEKTEEATAITDKEESKEETKA